MSRIHFQKHKKNKILSQTFEELFTSKQQPRKGPRINLKELFLEKE